MTDREKIINIVEQNKLCIVDVDCKDCQYKDKLDKTFTCGSYKLADLLIAANIGDVKTCKEVVKECLQVLRDMRLFCIHGYYSSGWNDCIDQAIERLAEKYCIDEEVE